MDSSVNKNYLTSGKYKYRAYHTSHWNKVLLLKADTQINQSLDWKESMDMNHGVSQLLLMVIRSGKMFSVKCSTGQKDLHVLPLWAVWALALSRHADWQAAQDLILSETVTVQIPLPTQQPSSRELTWSWTMRFSQNINKLCYKWIRLFPSSNMQLKQAWFPGNGHLLGFCVLWTTLPHWLFELHIIMYIVCHLWPVWAGSV